MARTQEEHAEFVADKPFLWHQAANRATRLAVFWRRNTFEGKFDLGLVILVMTRNIFERKNVFGKGKKEQFFG